MARRPEEPGERNPFAPPAPPPSPYDAPPVTPSYAPPPRPGAEEPYPPGYYPPPPGWPPPPPSRGGVLTTLLAVATLVVLVTGLVTVGARSGDDGTPAARRSESPYATKTPKPKASATGAGLRTPATVGGTDRMTSAFAKKVERDTKKTIPNAVDAQVALYGKGEIPRYFLFAGLSPEDTSREMFDEFAEGLVSNEGASAGKPRTMPGGLVCGTITIEELEGAACAWAGRKSNGVLVDYFQRDIDRLARLTGTARTYVNGG
jgi:hypothetical protein